MNDILINQINNTGYDPGNLSDSDELMWTSDDFHENLVTYNHFDNNNDFNLKYLSNINLDNDRNLLEYNINTIKNEYPALGFKAEVLSYTEILQNFIQVLLSYFTWQLIHWVRISVYRCFPSYHH